MPEKVALISSLQPKNTSLSIVWTLDGMTMLVSDTQSSNALRPMLTTLSGSDMLVNAVAAANAPAPIVFSPPPFMVTLASLTARLNPCVPMSSTLSGMTTVSS